MSRTILDVSRWQGRIDWDKVKASGLVSGVMIRAMGNSKEGKPSKPYIDPYFARNYAECQRLDIPVGVYGYFKATTKAQADRELALFKQALGGRTFQLPVAVDIEDKLQEALSKSALTDIVAHCLSVVESWGVYAMLYTGLYFGQNNLYMGGTALKWAQEIMSAETMEEAKALYERCPRLLKEKVKAILVKSEFEEITQ